MRDRDGGLLDTSVVIDLDRIDLAALPEQLAISAITLAELAAGPHFATDPRERAFRQARLQEVEATFSTLPFDESCARAYGLVYGAAVAANRSSRRRFADYLIAATALANGLRLYTRNASDLSGFEGLIDVATI